MPASPLCEARHGADPFVQISGSTFVVTPGSSLEVRLADAAGVATWDLECVSADDTSVALDIVRAAPPAMLATVDIPAGEGRAWLLRSRVNGGVSNGASDHALSYRFKLASLTTQGLEVGALDETTEAGDHGWLPIVNAAVRSAGSGGGVTPPAGAGVVSYAGGSLGFIPGVDGYALQFVGGLVMWAPLPAAGVPASRQLIAGDGLAGGGDFGADRTISLRLRTASGLQVDATGVGVLLPSATNHGLAVDASGLRVRIPNAGEGGSGLAITSSGIKVYTGQGLRIAAGGEQLIAVARPSAGLSVDSNGIGVVPRPSGGLAVYADGLGIMPSNGLVLGGAGAAVRLATTNPRIEFVGGGLSVVGRTLVHIATSYDDFPVSMGTMGTIALAGIQAGDVIDYVATLRITNLGTFTGEVRITNSANPATGVVWSSSAEGGCYGRTSANIDTTVVDAGSYTASATGNLWVHFWAESGSVARTNARLKVQVFR